MEIVGSAGIIIQAVDTGFAADLKAKVEAATLKARGTVQIGADTKSAEGAIAQLKAVAGRGTTTTKVNADTKDAEAAVSRLGGLATLAKSKLEGFAGSGNIVARSLKNAETAGLGLGDALKVGVAGGVIAAAGAIAVLTAKGISEFTALTAEVRKLKAATGDSAEGASEAANEARALGVDIDTLARGYVILSKNIEHSAEKFSDHGVVIATTKAGTVDLGATVTNIAEAYQHANSAQERNAILTDLLGRGGAALRPILTATREELEKLGKGGPIFSQDDLDKGRELAIAQRELGEAVKSLEADLAKGLVPVLVTAAHATTDFVHAIDSVARPLGGLGGVLSIVANQLTGGALSFLGLTRHTKDSAAATAVQVSVAKDLGVALDADEEKTGELTETTKKAIDAAVKHAETMASTAASIGLSSDALAAAIRFGTKIGAEGFQDEEDAAKALADAVTKAGEATRSAFAKDFSLADTFSASNLEAETKKQQDAVDKLAEAQQHLTDVQDKRSSKDAETVTQQQSLRDAYAKVAEAEKAVGAETALSTKLLDDHSQSFLVAKVALRSLITEEGNLSATQKNIVNFYEDSLVQAKSFSVDIRTAIAQGFDPALIGELLQKGPKEAGPLLAELVNDHSGRLREMVNASQEALGEINRQAVEMARLTALAVASHSDRLVKDLKAAMAIAQAEATTGGYATAQALSIQLGIGVDEVKRIMGEFGITVDSSTQRAADSTANHLANLATIMDRVTGRGVAAAGEHLLRFRNDADLTTGSVTGLTNSIANVPGGKPIDFTTNADTIAARIAILTQAVNNTGIGGGVGAELNFLQGLQEGGARASGGLVRAGWAYNVGEAGRERLTMFPGGGGYVAPLTTTAPTSPAVGARAAPLVGSMTIVSPNPQESGRDVVRALRAKQASRR